MVTNVTLKKLSKKSVLLPILGILLLIAVLFWAIGIEGLFTGVNGRSFGKFSEDLNPPKDSTVLFSAKTVGGSCDSRGEISLLQSEMTDQEILQQYKEQLGDYTYTVEEDAHYFRLDTKSYLMPVTKKVWVDLSPQPDSEVYTPDLVDDEALKLEDILAAQDDASNYFLVKLWVGECPEG